jgi:hypothetical protein
MKWRTAVLVALGATAPARAQDAAFPSVAGSGFFTLPDARTLPRGRVLAGATVDNRDRDPLGIDLFDLAATFTAGVTPRLEFYGSAVVSRVTAMPEVPALPPPPLDLIVAGGARAPAPPYYSVLWTVPYVNKRGTARLDDFVPGDALVGAKWRVRDGTGGAPALAVAGEIKLPLTRDPFDLASGSGTGGVDAGVRAIAEWGTRPACAASVRYTLVGRPARADRLITIDGNGGADAVDRPLDLPDRVDLGVGARYALRPGLAAAVEASASLDVGSRTPIVDATWPLDVIAGFQARAGHALFSAGLRLSRPRAPLGRPPALAGGRARGSDRRRGTRISGRSWRRSERVPRPRFCGRGRSACWLWMGPRPHCQRARAGSLSTTESAPSTSWASFSWPRGSSEGRVNPARAGVAP